MNVIKLVVLLCVLEECSILNAGTVVDDRMQNIVKSVASEKGEVYVENILSNKGKLKVIEDNWDTISGFAFPIGRPPYQVIATLLCNILYVSGINSEKNVFFVVKNLLIDQRNIKKAYDNISYKQETYKGKSYEQEFSQLLSIIKEKAKEIEHGLRAFQKAEEAVNYFDKYGEWPYDDDEGYYRVEDFLNDKDEEDVKLVIPMSESGSSSIQNSNETSPQKDVVQEKTSVLRSIPMELE